MINPKRNATDRAYSYARFTYWFTTEGTSKNLVFFAEAFIADSTVDSVFLAEPLPANGAFLNMTLTEALPADFAYSNRPM